MVIRIFIYTVLSGMLSCHSNKTQQSSEKPAKETTTKSSTPAASKPARTTTPVDSVNSQQNVEPTDQVKTEPVKTEPVKQNEAAKQDVYFEIERTPCFGKCPVYKMTIQADGMATLMGKQNIDYIGTYNKRVDKATMDMLVSEFNKAGFFNMKDEYTEKVMDLPTTWVTFKYKGKSKKIRDYYKAPQELKDLEKLLQNIAVGPGWNKVSE
jgi:hypothetical protein